MTSNIWSAVTRLAVCALALLITFTCVAYGRNWVVKDLRAVATTSQAAPTPKNESEVKTPVVRSLLKTLSELEAGDGTDEERRLMREQLLQADAELSTTLGDGSRKKILSANNPRLDAGNSRGFTAHPRGRLMPGARGRTGFAK